MRVTKTLIVVLLCLAVVVTAAQSRRHKRVNRGSKYMTAADARFFDTLFGGGSSGGSSGGGFWSNLFGGNSGSSSYNGGDYDSGSTYSNSGYDAGSNSWDNPNSHATGNTGGSTGNFWSNLFGGNSGSSSQGSSGDYDSGSTYSNGGDGSSSGNSWGNLFGGSSGSTSSSYGGSSAGQSAVDWALSKVGGCYSQTKRDGNPCYDCSSLVFYAWRHAGKSLTATNTRMYPGNTRRISASELQPGDILWRSGHVAMYVDSSTIVHAANTQRGIVTDRFNAGSWSAFYRP